VFQVDKLRKWKQDHVEQMASDLEDDATCGSDMNRRLSDLRKEVAAFIIYAGCLLAVSAASAFFLSATEPVPCLSLFSVYTSKQETILK